MAIDGIGSVCAVNVSRQTKTSVQTDAQVASVASSTGRVEVETIQPVVAKNGGNQNAGTKEQDRASVQSDKEISPEKVKSAVDDLNKQIKSNLRRTQCSFKYHEETNRISITVIDSDTDEVIREIPPEKALDMLAKAWELAGLLVDERR